MLSMPTQCGRGVRTLTLAPLRQGQFYLVLRDSLSTWREQVTG